MAAALDMSIALEASKWSTDVILESMSVIRVSSGFRSGEPADMSSSWPVISLRVLVSSSSWFVNSRRCALNPS
jgi:hypothetical protein